MFNNFPKHSGVYHIRDNIDKFEIEINFRHVHSLLRLPIYEVTSNGIKFDGKETNDINDESSSITARIKWQQKLLSPKEMELYKNIQYCITDTQKKYNKLLNENDENGKIKSKKRRKKSIRNKASIMNEIYTYVEDDNFIPEEEKADEGKIHHNLGANTMKPVSMYIYAAISPDIQLVSLKWYTKERLLYIYPDFNDIHADPYYIGINSDYRHLYAYAVTNVSVSRLERNPEHNIIIMPKLQTHWQTERDLKEKFQMPPKRMKRFVLLYEIRSACMHFAAYQPMHVRYHVHLPENCSLEEGMAEASTHASFAPRSPNMCSFDQGNYNNCFHYGYNFQLTILCEDTFKSSDMLHIYFELISIDNWERERLEGYAHYSTYLTLGTDSKAEELQCVQPAGNLLDKLTRYFIGGRKMFDYVGFFTPSKNADIPLHNCFGCSMTNSGHLHVQCQKISQRNCELLSPCKSRCIGMTLDDILLAYTQARQRLENLILE